MAIYTIYFCVDQMICRLIECDPLVLECGDRGHWEQNGSQDAEADNSAEIAVPEVSLSSFPHKNGEIYTCQYCNR